MEKSISASDANRNFSKLLQGVRRGRSFVVTSHGQPVATIAPVKSSSRGESAARAMLFKRLREQPVMDVGSWRRDELYEDGA